MCNYACDFAGLHLHAHAPINVGYTPACLCVNVCVLGVQIHVRLLWSTPGSVSTCNWHVRVQVLSVFQNVLWSLPKDELFSSFSAIVTVGLNQDFK